MCVLRLACTKIVLPDKGKLFLFFVHYVSGLMRSHEVNQVVVKKFITQLIRTWHGKCVNNRVVVFSGT